MCNYMIKYILYTVYRVYPSSCSRLKTATGNDQALWQLFQGSPDLKPQVFHDVAVHPAVASSMGQAFRHWHAMC